VSPQAPRAAPGAFSAGRPAVPGVGGPIDLDRATAPEIEALPRVGPALARRIVANRDSAGPFGSIEALRRIRGLGPATLTLLAPLVTFSGQARR
jgi:competence protein ComEA